MAGSRGARRCGAWAALALLCAACAAPAHARYALDADILADIDRHEEAVRAIVHGATREHAGDTYHQLAGASRCSVASRRAARARAAVPPR